VGRLFLSLLTFLLVTACSTPTVPPARGTTASTAAGADASTETTRPEIVFLGDSLTAGLGLDTSASFPSLIQARLDAEGLDYAVVNAGVSGDTSAGGLRRLDWSLEGDPRVMLLALGANDGLRGLPTTELEKNLAQIIERAQEAGVAVVLAGMEAPPNYGPEYTRRFRQVYPDLAREYDVPLIPFLLQGVAGDRALNQADGIHPNSEGARRVADIVWDALIPVLAVSGTR